MLSAPWRRGHFFRTLRNLCVICRVTRDTHVRLFVSKIHATVTLLDNSSISLRTVTANYLSLKSLKSVHKHIFHHNMSQENKPPVASLIAQECYACRKAIKERYLLKALDQLWHEDCLKCSCCDCRLGEVGSTLFTKANLILCKRDYLRYGTVSCVHTCAHFVACHR